MRASVLPPAEAVWREQCRRTFAHFAGRYCQVLSETAGASADWIPFDLWPAQRDVARQFQEHRLLVVLKARQLGLTWLALAFGLWHVLLHPVATVLLFSKRDDEATDLLTRLKGMHQRLPPWLRARRVVTDNGHEWGLANGSRVLAFPTTAGDSYTATLAVVDEADLVPDLDRLLRAVKPATDAKGRLLLISRVDKSKPESAFKRIYRAAKQGQTDWVPVFLPWSARPDRDAAWYESQQKDVLARTGSLDDLHEQYPAADTEALTPRTLDKRLAPAWLHQCYQEQAPLADLPAGAPAIPGLEVYAPPVPGRKYVIGADPAEGNPQSDDSALVVLDADTAEESASLAGKFDPSVFAAHVAAVSAWYNSAAAMVERNNHGHAVLLWLRDNAPRVRLLRDGDGRGDGWNTTSKSKAQLWTTGADAVRDGGTTVHSFAAFTQLASIEGATLRAPEGQHDDRAVAFALALAGIQRDRDIGDFFQLRVIPLAPDPFRVPLPPESMDYPDMRYFPPSGTFQPWLELRGSRVWLNDYKTQEQAGYALHLARELLGLPAPPFDRPALEADVVRQVEKRVRDFLRQARLTP
jgi:hypothetical protein